MFSTQFRCKAFYPWFVCPSDFSFYFQKVKKIANPGYGLSGKCELFCDTKVWES